MPTVGVKLPQVSSGLYYDINSRTYYLDAYGKYPVPYYEATRLRSGQITLAELSEKYGGEKIKQEATSQIVGTTTSTGKIDVIYGSSGSNITTTTTGQTAGGETITITEKRTTYGGTDVGYSITAKGEDKNVKYTESPVITSAAGVDIGKVAGESIFNFAAAAGITATIAAAAAAPVISPIGVGAGLALGGLSVWNIGTAIGTRVKQDFFGGASFWDYMANPRVSPSGYSVTFNERAFVEQGIPFLSGLAGSVAGGYVGAKIVSRGYGIEIGETKSTALITKKEGDTAFGVYGTATPYEVTWSIGKGEPIHVRSGIVTSSMEPFIASRTKGITGKDVYYTTTEATSTIIGKPKGVGMKEYRGINLGFEPETISKLSGFTSKLDTGIFGHKVAGAGFKGGLGMSDIFSSSVEGRVFDLNLLYSDVPEFIPKIIKGGGISSSAGSSPAAPTITQTSSLTGSGLGAGLGMEPINIQPVNIKSAPTTIAPTLPTTTIAGKSGVGLRNEPAINLGFSSGLSFGTSFGTSQSPLSIISPITTTSTLTRTDTMQRTGQRTSLIEFTGGIEGIGEMVMPISAMTPITSTGTMVTPIAELTPRSPPEFPPSLLPPNEPPLITGIGFGIPLIGGGGGGRRRRKTRSTKKKDVYQPSLLGLATGIKTPQLKRQKWLTGFEIRGL